MLVEQIKAPMDTQQLPEGTPAAWRKTGRFKKLQTASWLPEHKSLASMTPPLFCQEGTKYDAYRSSVNVVFVIAIRYDAYDLHE